MTEVGSTLIDINDSNAEDLAGSKYVVLKFGAVWCGPCRQIRPVLQKLQTENKDVTFAQCDVDESAQMSVKFGIRNIPVIAFFKDGEEIRDLRLIGTQTKERLQGHIASLKRWQLEDTYEEFKEL